MIYEFRTYTLKPGSLAEVEKRFGEGYEHRKKFSPLAAFWHTEIGPLNEIIHVWGYKDQAERNKIRAEARQARRVAAEDLASSSSNMRSEIVHPFPFVRRSQARQDGADLRDALLHDSRRARCPDIIKRWEGKIAGADEVLAARRWPGTCEHGEANSYMHIWPYESLEPPCGDPRRRRARRARGRLRAAATCC